MRLGRSLGQRVVWAVTGTVALLVGLQSLLAYVAMRAQEDELSETMLSREVQQITVHLLQPGLTPTGQLLDSNRVRAWLVRDGNGNETLPSEMRGLGPGLFHFAPQGHSLHVAVNDTDDGRLIVILDATATEKRVDEFGYIVAGLWLLCIGAAVWIARRVAAIAIRPIVSATRTIARSAPGAPLATSAQIDEASVLTETFQRFRDRVDAVVQREREFAANLDHEIRTPLTSIRTDAELLGLEGRLSPGQQRRLERIVSAVDEIVATTASTLSYSSGRFGGAEVVDVREAVLSAGAGLMDSAESRGLRIVVDVAEGARVGCDRQALLTVIRNLLRNAIDHAAPATLRVTGDARVVVFTDDGPGIASERIAEIVSGTRGSARVDQEEGDGRRIRGLGMAIVRRLCEMQGWQLAIRSPATGLRGTAFTITFETGQSSA